MSEFKLVIAHHPYEAQREDEISFEQDEIIKVTDFSDPDWWVGKKKDGSLGFFPSNFVTPKDDDNEESKETLVVEKSKDDVQVTTEEAGKENEAEVEEEKVEEEKKVDQVIGMARVMEDYAMQEQGELSLHRGGIVNVYEIIDDQWSRGELNGKVGKYPSKYVEDIDMPGRPDLGQQQQSNESQTSPVDEDAPKGGFKLAAFGVKQGGIGSLLAGGFPGLKKTGGAKPEPAPIVPAATAPVAPAETVAAPAIPTVSKPTQEEPTETQKPLGKAIVLHPYDAESEDELSLLRGEYVQILDRHIDDGWWKGLNEKGQSGVFPCNFVRELEDELVAPPTPTRARRNVPSRPSSVQTPVTARPISVQAPAQRPSSVSGVIAAAKPTTAQLHSPSIAEEEPKEEEEEDTPVQSPPAVEEVHTPPPVEQVPVIEQAPVEKVSSPPVPERVASPVVVSSPPVPERVASPVVVSSPPVPERVESPVVEQVQPPIVERVVSPPVPERAVSSPTVTSPPIPERVSPPAITSPPVPERVLSPPVPERVVSPPVTSVTEEISSPVELKTTPDEAIEESSTERKVSLSSEDIESPIKEDSTDSHETKAVEEPVKTEEESESAAVSEKPRGEEEKEGEEEIQAVEEKNEFDDIPSGPKLTTPSRVRIGGGRARRSPQVQSEPSQTEVLQKELAQEEEKAPSPPAKPVKPIFAKFPTPFAVGGDVLSKSHLKPTQTRRLWEEKPAVAAAEEEAEEPAPVRPSGVKNIASRFNFAGGSNTGGNEVLETKLKNHTKNEIEKVKKEYELLLNEQRERVACLEKIVQDLIEKVNALEKQ